MRLTRRTFSAWTAFGIVVALTRELRAGTSPFTHRALRDPSNERTSLGEAAGGKRLVVVVMKGAWCPVCVGQLRRLAEQKAKIDGLGARVVGLSADSPAENRKAAASLPFPILSDPKREVIEALGLWQPRWGHPMPAVLVFDRCGTERGRITGRRPGHRAGPAVLGLLERLKAKPPRCRVANA